MKLIIDISEELYAKVPYLINKGSVLIRDILDAVKNGTPVDLEGLKSDMKALNCGFPYGLDYLLDCLNKRLGITITEAEMSGGGEDEISD